MDSNSKRKEINALIDNIKQHSDRLTDIKAIPMLELSVILSKINRLHESTVILKYLMAQEHGLEDEEFKIDLFSRPKHHSISSEDSDVDEEVQIDLLHENSDDIEDNDEIYVEMEVDEEDVKSIDLEEDEEVFVEMEVDSEDDEEDYVLGEIEEEIEDPDAIEESASNYIDEVDDVTVDKIIKNLEVENIGNLPDINEQYKDEDASLGEQLQRQPISDLVSSIGLNERYFYANELFGGDLERFKKELNTLNEFENRESAQQYFQELAQNNNWEKANEMAKALQLLVERRYI